MTTTNVTDVHAQAHLADLLDQAISEREPIIITRHGRESFALIAASELGGLIETVHLLRSRANAERLLTALDRARSRAGTPTTPGECCAEFGLRSE